MLIFLPKLSLSMCDSPISNKHQAEYQLFNIPRMTGTCSHAINITLHIRCVTWYVRQVRDVTKSSSQFQAPTPNSFTSTLLKYVF